MDTWIPCIAQTRSDLAFLQSSLAEVLLAAARRHGTSVVERARTLLDAWPGGAEGLPHPETFWMLHRYASADACSAEEWLEALALAMAATQRSRARVAARTDLAVDLVCDTGRARATLLRALATKHDLSRAEHGVIVERLTDDEMETLRTAYGLLVRTWPEILDELVSFVACVHFFEFEGMLGFTDHLDHGAVYIRRQDLRDPVVLAEQFVHEGSHVRLNASMFRTTYFRDSQADARYRTPLRRDPRPMFGAFHQMFVLARMKHLYDRLDAPAHHERQREVRESFEAAFDLITAECNLTDEGQALVDALAPLRAV